LAEDRQDQFQLPLLSKRNVNKKLFFIGRLCTKLKSDATNMGNIVAKID
jgi:hypothetical protein